MNSDLEYTETTFNIYKLIDIIFRNILLVIIFPIFVTGICISYLNYFPGPSLGIINISIDNNDIKNQNFNKVSISDIGMGINDLSAAEKKNTLNQAYTQIVYSTLTSNKFFKNILEGSDLIKKYNSDELYLNYTDSIGVLVTKDDNANIDLLEIRILLSVTKNQMKDLVTKSINELDIKINQRIKSVINAKLEDLDVLYNTNKFNINRKIEYAEIELQENENALSSNSSKKSELTLIQEILDNKMTINNLLISLVELENFYKYNFSLFNNINSDVDENFYNLDRENITFSYSNNFRPDRLYIILTIIISLVIVSLFLIIFNGYKAYKSKS